MCLYARAHCSPGLSLFHDECYETITCSKRYSKGLFPDIIGHVFSCLNCENDDVVAAAADLLCTFVGKRHPRSQVAVLIKAMVKLKQRILQTAGTMLLCSSKKCFCSLEELSHKNQFPLKREREKMGVSEMKQDRVSERKKGRFVTRVYARRACALRSVCVVCGVC